MTARFPSDHVHIEGQSTEFVQVGSSGNKVRFHFCPECGSTVYYLADAISGEVFVPVGAFADPGFPRPTKSFYESRKHEWLQLPDHMDHHG